MLLRLIVIMRMMMVRRLLKGPADNVHIHPQEAGGVEGVVE